MKNGPAKHANGREYACCRMPRTFVFIRVDSWLHTPGTLRRAESAQGDVARRAELMRACEPERARENKAGEKLARTEDPAPPRRYAGARECEDD